jgi:hypothetical protein
MGTSQYTQIAIKLISDKVTTRANTVKRKAFTNLEISITHRTTTDEKQRLLEAIGILLQWRKSDRVFPLDNKEPVPPDNPPSVVNTLRV